MTRVWLVREADAVPRMEVEEWPLGTDEEVFWYDNARVCRDERTATQWLMQDLLDVSEELRAAIEATTARLAELGEREGEP